MSMNMPNTLFTDQAIEQAEREHFSGPATENDRLVGSIINWIRRANVTVSPPAHIEPIIWSQAIDLTARVSVPAAVGDYVTAVEYQVPEGRYARIDTYGVQVDDAAYTYNGSILWRFRVNGINVPNGLSDWGEQRGSLPSPRKTFIVLKQEDLIQFQVRRAVAAAGPQDVEMGITGWTWRLRMNYEGTGASVTAF